MTTHKKYSFIKSAYLVLLAFAFMGCKKAELESIQPAKTTTAVVATVKADSLKAGNYDAAETKNPEYWYNGTTGTALIRVSCKECSAIATIGDKTVPFMINDEGVGYLKYTPQTGLPIKIAVCPGRTQAVNVHILDANKETLFSYLGVITANWVNTFVLK